MAETYTHKDLAKLCSVSETTIKSYRRKFPGFIPVLTRGKPIRFKKEAADVCLKIRDCFEKGMSVRETGKVLKEHFKEDPKSKPMSQPTAQAGGGSGVVSEEYLDQFFSTAGQMMQGMASLATAQAKTGQRLEKLENAVNALLEAETRNAEMFGQLMGSMKEAPAKPAADKTPTPEAAPAPPKSAEKSRTRKVVVTDREGSVKSYTLQKEEKAPESLPKRPSDAFLNTPIVILNEQGEFLGVPGRLPLAGFMEILLREADEAAMAHANWRQVDDNWVFTMKVPGGDSHELYFKSTTTPRGNLVVLLDRLDVNSKQTSANFLQEFFRQVKDKIQDS